VSALALGLLASTVLPAPTLNEAGAPDLPAYLALPFGLLLLSIALMPFVHAQFWEHHYPDFAFLLGGLVVAYYLTGLPGFGPARIRHVGLEYFQFIALIGSLYVVCGGVLIDLKGQGTPLANTVLLAAGALSANLVGTTGAATLLIRPYIRINKHRIRSFHIMLFIFIVANCGGCLTPIGDPPLFLGYLQGVPFTWTISHCLPAWALCVGALLAVFYAMDRYAFKGHLKAHPGEASGATTTVRISGGLNFFWLSVVIFGVFLDKLLHESLQVEVHFPFGACLQIAAAAAAYKTSKAENLQANEFTFKPIKEVGLLFIGIFATMVPALDYLQAHAGRLGVDSPSSFYWATGSLSSFLDNAPTYLNFLTAAHGLATPPIPVGLPPMGDTPRWMALNPLGVTGFPAEPILLAIALGSVFFGASTYIGNGPNFMVKAISEAAGVRMPSFFGYIVKYTLPILLPIFVVVWLVFVR